MHSIITNYLIQSSLLFTQRDSSLNNTQSIIIIILSQWMIESANFLFWQLSTISFVSMITKFFYYLLHHPALWGRPFWWIRGRIAVPTKAVCPVIAPYYCTENFCNESECMYILADKTSLKEIAPVYLLKYHWELSFWSLSSTMINRSTLTLSWRTQMVLLLFLFEEK